MTTVDPPSHCNTIRAVGVRPGAASVTAVFVLVLAAACAAPAVDPAETATGRTTRISDPPPSEAGAAATLATSPRHGEWVEVELDGDSKYPVLATYRNLAAFRELKIIRDRLDRVESYPPDIWNPLGERGR